MKILDDVDIQKWKSFLSMTPDANIFQTPEMYDVWVGTKNYKPVVIANQKGSDLTDLVLGCIIKEGGRIKGALSSRAIVTGGPLAIGGDPGSTMAAFDDAVRSRALYTEIRNLREMSTQRQALEEIGYVYEDHLNFVHDLTQSRDEIFAGFSEGRQKGIMKAEERGIRCSEGGKQDLASLYGLLLETYREAGIPLADATLFENAWRVLKPSNMVHIFNAKVEDELLASRITLSYNGILYDWYAGSSPLGKRLNANEFLVWSIMRWGSDNEYLAFDFGGAGKPGEKYGPGEFKRRFGGELTNFGRFRRMHHPVKHIVGRKGYEVVKRFR